MNVHAPACKVKSLPLFPEMPRGGSLVGAWPAHSQICHHKAGATFMECLFQPLGLPHMTAILHTCTGVEGVLGGARKLLPAPFQAHFLPRRQVVSVSLHPRPYTVNELKGVSTWEYA